MVHEVFFPNINKSFSADLSLRVIAPNLLCTVIGQLRDVMVDSTYLFLLLATLQKRVSQIRTLKIVTLNIEHLKVFCLHTPSVPDFNTK